ncbi:MAG: tRNA (guanosine(37)-N1)-methyltransferase TrmD [Bombilactobacillus mellifer]|uniref:tRNA (guanosine(37)-N1)-methyltransferase TrmD n=1 Tax=Bombilactobacillus mellifer TaxID=1218492 RepID=UPI0018DE31B9|nr:tRNA (guanosine(37)-N1)-methyltransferase TrmD [Bombilactobacillus mellifer]MBH9990879.1 tRNA (guanosine(37)-N1)-methyltransferase TrmD [Lactobacillus sp. W8092]MCT6826042.1 tRNA (guanosine(37)-N1)-methyltransferase TrmD [Bombilactobacillus mellifer]MCT6894343.1 tRNA (guanosine(37)-N1)-methyltransferase TrmD [Bombilactobacillus mellifer]
MKIDILTLFPQMFAPLNESLLGKAQAKQLLEIAICDFRQYATNKQHHVDDTPYGGGAGMLLQPQPIYRAMDVINAQDAGKKRVILLDPAGQKFNQALAQDLAQEQHLVFICGHYEGFDERIERLATDKVSLGDFVLTGGEMAAMVMIDALARFVPGVLGNETSAYSDSFSAGLLEYPQYTRPAEYRGMKVPEILLSGNHQKIAQWRRQQALKKTWLQRPDLLAQTALTTADLNYLDTLTSED